MNYLRRIAGQTAVYGLSSVVPRLLNYILVPLHTRVLLQEDYGIVTELYAYLAVLLVILTFGFETGFFRFATKENDNNVTYSTAFYTLLTTSFIFILLISIFSNNISSFLNYTDHPEYIYLPAIIIGLDAFSAIPFAKLRLLNKAFTFATIKILGVSINVLLNIFFLVIAPRIEWFSNFSHFTKGNYILFILISNLVSTLFVTLTLLLIRSLQPTIFSFSRLKTLFFYSFPLLISGFGGTTNEFLDRIFLKNILPEDSNPLYQLGIYGANLKLAILMVLFIQMYRYAAEPFFFSNSDKKDSPEMYANLTKYFLIFTLIIFLGVGLFTEVFQVLIGMGYREGIGIVPILLLANLIFGVYYNFSIWYKLVNKTWYGIFYTFIGAIITIFLYFLLIPIIGYYGAAIAKLVCYIIITALCYVGGQRNYPIPYQISRFALYTLLAITLFLIGYFVNF
jgi:O-antigen/teichoic acid export membrane protein